MNVSHSGFAKISIQPVISEFHELLCSLHVLVQPEHHPRRLAWAKELAGRLPADLFRTLAELGALSDGWTALLDLPDYTGRPMPAEEGIAWLASVPDAELLFLLMNGRARLGSILGWIGGARGLESEEMERDGLELLAGLSAVRARLCDALTSYYTGWFRQEWQSVLPWLHEAADDFAHRAKAQPEKALGSLHPRLTAAGGVLAAQKAQTYTFAADKLKRILVFPSTFIHPHLLIGWTESMVCLPLAVEVPGQTADAEAPGDLIRRFKALGDPTRLKLLKLMWDRPYCTKQLAPLLGISEAAVSKQLKLLAGAGLVRARRSGSYLFYATVREELEMTQVLQRQFFEQ